MKKLSKQATYWLSVVAIGLVLGLSIQFVTAWTEPPVGTTPPANNVGAPINTSATAQTKSGILTVNPANFLVPSGNSGFGTATPSYRVDVVGSMRLQPTTAPTGANGVTYYDSATNKFRCYQNSAWVDCVGSGGGGTVTNIATGAGLTGGPITTTGTISLNTAGISACTNSTTSKIFWDSANNRLGCGTDQTGGGGGITCSGTCSSGNIPKFTGASSVANSQITDNGTNVGINATPSATYKLTVGGGIYTNGNIQSGAQVIGSSMYSSNTIQAGTNIATNNYSTTLPGGWSGVHTNDVFAKWSMRTNQLCLGGTGGGTDLGTCLTSWSAANDNTTTVVTGSQSCGAGWLNADAFCPSGYARTGCSGYFNYSCFGEWDCDYLGEVPWGSGCRASARGRAADNCVTAYIYCIKQ